MNRDLPHPAFQSSALQVVAEMLLESIPHFEAAARKSALQYVVFSRAVTRPWEGDPAVAALASTPPAP
jgi:hypothetical protein